METGTQPRREYELADGWTFALNTREEQAFRPVALPHDWAIGSSFDRNMEEGESQGFRSRFGIGWYRKEFFLAEKKEKHLYFLEFGGIYENSAVWVNEKAVGGRKYGYSSFRLDVTEALQEGENRIEIRVDNTRRPSDRWYSGAGIYRAVKLVETEAVHLDPWEVAVHTRIEGGTAHISVRCGLEGRTVRAELTELNGTGQEEAAGRGPVIAVAGVEAENETVGAAAGAEAAGGLAGAAAGAGAEGGPVIAAAAGSTGTLEFTAEPVKLWSAEEPNLYLLTLSLLDGERIADQISFRIGLRTVEMRPGQGMFVNGNKVRLQGVCLHQDVGCLGIAARKEIFRQRLLALKEMGCNAVRPAHHTYSSEFLDLCDELGFYVYEECFDKWHGGLYGRYFQTEWRRDVDAMVRRDRNRPCVVMWGVGNEVENQGQESMLKTLKLLTEYVRTLDDRPVTCAMNPHFKREDSTDLSKVRDIQQFVDEVSDTEIYDNGERVERIERIAEYVDVIACNYQEQWYPLIHERIPGKLILGTEVYQYFMGDFNQMQNFTGRSPVLAAQEADYAIGSFIWTGIDYLGESMGYPAKGWGGSLIRTNGSRRPGYYILQSYWSKKPMVHLSVMDYSLEDEGVKEHWDIPMLADHWHFPQFHKTVIPYVIASNCEEVRLFLNGKRIYLPKPADCENRLITGFLPWQAGTVEAVGFNGGMEVCRHSLTTPKEAVQLGFLGDAWTFAREKSVEIRKLVGIDAEIGGAGTEPGSSAVEKPGSSASTEAGSGAPVEDCMRLCARAGYQLQLAVGAFDEAGNPCFRESARVRFRIEGPAKLLAVDAGELTGNEPYQERSIHLFRGQASVMLALTGEAGRICVYADAAGMRTACQVILAE